MAFEDFEDLFIHTVTLEPRTGLDQYSRPQYGSPFDMVARIEWGPRAVRGADGREVVVGAKIFVPPSPVLDVNHRITMPDGEKPPILRIEQLSDEHEEHHQVIFVQGSFVR